MRFDVIIKNGNIIDGAGNPYYRGDIGIHNGRIEKIGFLKNEQAGEVIDAADLAVCPGFIDVHSHSDAAVYFDNTLPSTIRQGITTSLLGESGAARAGNPAGLSQTIRCFCTAGPQFRGGALEHFWRIS